MAELKVKNLKKVQTNIRRQITKALRDKDIRDGVGEIVVEEIQNTRFGTAGKSTKAWRAWLEKGNKTHSKYLRNLINITFTGELLNDLKTNVKARFSKGKSSYVIAHSKKKHRKYRKPNGKPSKGRRLSYEEISDEVIKKGYDYLTFSDKSKKRVLNFIKERVFKKLK